MIPPSPNMLGRSAPTAQTSLEPLPHTPSRSVFASTSIPAVAPFQWFGCVTSHPVSQRSLELEPQIAVPIWGSTPCDAVVQEFPSQWMSEYPSLRLHTSFGPVPQTASRDSGPS